MLICTPGPCWKWPRRLILQTVSIVFSFYVGRGNNGMNGKLFKFWCRNVLNGWKVLWIMQFLCFICRKFIKRVCMYIMLESDGTKLFRCLRWKNFKARDVFKQISFCLILKWYGVMAYTPVITLHVSVLLVRYCID